MLINRTEIERVIRYKSDQIQAEEYAQNGTFESFSIRFVPQEELYQVDALFRARYYRNRMRVMINRQNEIVSMQCDCPYCSSTSGCAHVGAMLLKLEEMGPVPLPYQQSAVRKMDELSRLQQKRQNELLKHNLDTKNQLTLALMDEIQLQSERNIDAYLRQGSIRIEPVLEKEWDQKGNFILAVRYRIGEERTVYIKDLALFLQHLDEEATSSYGKNLTLDHYLDEFDESAQKQIEFLRSQRSAIEASSLKGHSLVLSENNLDSFFDCYINLEEKVEFVFETVRMDFVLEMKKETIEKESWISLKLNQSMKNILFTSQYAYQFTDHRLARLVLDNRRQSLKLLRYFAQNDKLVIKEDQLGEFYITVLSELEDWFMVQGLENYTLPVLEEDLELYGDLDEQGRIVLLLCAMQDNKRVYAFDSKRSVLSVKMRQAEKMIEPFIEERDEESHQVYLPVHQEETETFLMKTLPALGRWMEVYITDALKKLTKAEKISFKAGISFSNDLLQVDLESLEINRDEIVGLLKAYKRKKKYHRLKNGQMILFDRHDIQPVAELFEQLDINADDLKNGPLSLPLYRAFSLEDEHLQKTIQWQRDYSYQQFLNRFRQGFNEEIVMDDHYERLMHDYQKEGFMWLKKISSYGFGGILADDMGLGKTLQMIAYLESEKKADRVNLVVCPSSLILNWQDEIARFSKELKVVAIYGSMQEREKKIAKLEKSDVGIISYDYLRRDIDRLKEFQFHTVVLDEAQTIKNSRTRNAVCVKSLNSTHRFALTGTPIENNLAELWSIFDFLMPGYLYSYPAFLRRYERPIVKENDEQASLQLKKMVEPFILRRNKQEVLKNLPDKVENTYLIEFEEEERKLYLANLIQVNQQVQKKIQSSQVDKIAVLAMLMRLRQMCCEPRMIYENIHKPSSKLTACLELITALHRSHHKMLLFSSFTQTLDYLQAELNQMGISSLLLTGKTKKEERRRLIQQFQSDDTAVFLISLKAGGTGLNLTAAEAVIHYDPWWNISAVNQATDRAYRIGQNKNVHVFKLIMKDSIEEKIMELQKKKQNLSDLFIENSSGSIASMNMEEIAELLKMD